MWRLLPFAHAMAECDCLASGKAVALRKLNSVPVYKEMAEVFCDQESCGDIVCAGEIVLSSF